MNTRLRFVLAPLLLVAMALAACWPATPCGYIRDEEALRLAERVYELTDDPDATVLDTLAAA